MNRFILASFLLVSVAGSARASFDLVMVADTGTKSIHRFDGTTGIYLGSFAGGMVSTINSFTIDQATNRAYVCDLNLGLTRIFDYNTGELVGDTVANEGSYQSLAMGAGGTLVSGYVAGGVAVRNTSSVFQGYFFTQPISGYGSIGRGSALHQSGRQIILTYKNDVTPGANLQISNGLGNTTGVVSTVLTDMGAYNSLGAVAVQGDRGTWVGGDNRARYFSLGAGASSITLGSGGTMGVFASSTLTGVAYGHGNSTYMVGRNVGNTSGIISRGVHGSYSSLSTFGSGILQTPGQVYCVVAPEPGTMLALGAGIAGIFVRRRRSRR